ncbi:DNA-binding transcriptional MerR regulator [Geodermatophilus bullaregiensis]|uniref:MerR family transcriptional regulator n=1 Tax=Geodermatophilus bullaregiensis TaxID=1564160 RepID=UPI0027DB4717|nr:MerR family transcriptional regulator [Geodermatophilus bullaregiensis]MBM7808408.1 DNA-binding transcriptional MerR regulator [Geodermatophilus bullaregiensis]
MASDGTGRRPGTGTDTDPTSDAASDAVRRLDDPDFPALTMSQAAALLGVQAAFLRSLDGSGVLQPHRSPGGHRRYSRHQLLLAARLRGLLDEGHTLASAEVILGLQDELADARATSERLRDTVDRLRTRRDDGDTTAR